jgi:hypothetical protein
MRSRSWLAVVVVFLLLGVALGVAVADRRTTAPPLIYSGVLLDGGAPVADGPHDIGLSVFADETGGTALCTMAPSSRATTAGHFSLPVSAAECGDAIQHEEELYVELSVDGTSFPRSRVGAVPYAISAERLVLRSDTGAITTGLYCGATMPVSGRIRAAAGTPIGYAGARDRCATACGSSTAHMCTSDELLRTLALGRDDFGRGWVATGAYDTSRADVDCWGFTENTVGVSGVLGASTMFTGRESGGFQSVSCDMLFPVLCCD